MGRGGVPGEQRGTAQHRPEQGTRRGHARETRPGRMRGAPPCSPSPWKDVGGSPLAVPDPSLLKQEQQMKTADESPTLISLPPKLFFNCFIVVDFQCFVNFCCREK